MTAPRFGLTGAAGFVAPRHLQALRACGGRLIAALDPHDAVGRLDDYGFGIDYFRELELFSDHLEALRASNSPDAIDWLTVCSPNYLHDAHVRLGLRVGADVICEKPMSLTSAGLDAMQAAERLYGGRVFTILQLRHHPALVALKARIEAVHAATPIMRHKVSLSYVTARGKWYAASWKGDPSKSGGLLTNIGCHAFDLLSWVFGAVKGAQVWAQDDDYASGCLDLERAYVEWELSTRPEDVHAAFRACRVLTVDGESISLDAGFGHLHTQAYEEIIAGRGFGIEDARPSIALVERLRGNP